MSKAFKPLALAAGAVIVAVAGWSQAQQGTGAPGTNPGGGSGTNPAEMQQPGSTQNPATQNPAMQNPATQNPAPGTTDPATSTSPDAGAAGTTQPDNAATMDARADRN
jgi:hypothetical protein